MVVYIHAAGEEDFDLDGLDGLSFRDLFDRLVLRDGGVRDRLREAAVVHGLPEFQPTIDFAATLNSGQPWKVRLDPEREAQRLCAGGGDASASATPAYPADAELALEAFFRAFKALVDLLRGGFLVAHGVLPDGARSAIPAMAWWRPDVLIDVAASELFEGYGDHRDPRCGSIQVFRPRVSADQLDGLPLSDAFSRFVLQDAGVQALAGHVERESRINACYSLGGLYWGGYREHQHWWPLLMHKRVLVSGGYMSIEGQFKNAIADRMRLFLQPLLAGEAHADGYDEKYNEKPVRKSVWCEDYFYIHADANHIADWDDGQGFMSHEGPQVVFRNVELHSVRSAVDQVVAGERFEPVAGGENTPALKLPRDQQQILDVMMEIWPRGSPDLRRKDIIAGILDHFKNKVEGKWMPSERTIDRVIKWIREHPSDGIDKR